jgi:hypothetical protein
MAPAMRSGASAKLSVAAQIVATQIVVKQIVVRQILVKRVEATRLHSDERRFRIHAP